MNKNQLESLLWCAAELWRGQVDAPDNKHYFFPLLFYIQLSDVYLEEYSEAQEIYEGHVEYVGLPMFHRFDIPEQGNWQSVRDASKNIGEAIQYALRLIEVNSSRLHSELSDAQWPNKELFDKAHSYIEEHY
jgi:type I restriction enzyme M protein